MFLAPLLAASFLLPAGRDGLEVTLGVDGEYARDSDTVAVKVDIVANSDAAIRAGLLTGAGLDVRIDGTKLGRAKEDGSVVPVKKGTKLSVEVPMALGGLLEKAGKLGAPEPVKVEFSVPGASTAAASLTVVKDLAATDVKQLDAKKTRVAIVTNFGTMVVAFRPDKAPKTVENFLKLAKSHFYDGTRFHRVIKGFMIQGGDPNTRDDNPMNDGTGGPGYQIEAEFNDIKHDRGILSMARSTDPNSAGSQFFVMHGRAPHLDNQYTAFGALASGLDVLDRICDVPVMVQPGSPEKSRPTRDIWLIRAVVLGVMK